MAISIPSCIGIVITALASISLILNLFVLFILYRGGLLKPSKSNIYLLAFANITSNCIRAAVIAFYMGPSIILQQYLFSDDPRGIGNRIFSFIENATWNVDMFITAIIAINRLSVIVFTNGVGKIFTRTVVKILAIFLFVSGYLLALVSHKIIPCCVHLFYIPRYWGDIIDTGFNYNDYFIDIPVNIISSSISLICYTTVYFYIRQAYRKIDPKLTCMAAEARRRKEVRYALQFGALSLFALFAWVSHRIFPNVFVNDENLEIMSLVTISVIIHGTMNSIIFLAINREVKKCVRQYLETVSSTTLCLPQTHKQAKRRYAAIRIPLSKSLKILQQTAAPQTITPNHADFVTY